MKYDAPSDPYWLYRWIDDNGIRNLGDLYKVLRRPGCIDRILELNSSDRASAHSSHDALDYSVIAGRRVDLSGFLGCPHFECVLPQIDTLFGKTWHYFDVIVVDDPELRSPDRAYDKFIWDFEQRIRLLLYLRKIGASKYVAFQRKLSGYCQLHFREFAERNNLGLDLLFNEALESQVVEEFLRSARFAIEKHEDGTWGYEIFHPKLERVASTYSHSDPDMRPTNEEVARDAYGVYCSGLISDVAAAHDLGFPLLQVADGFMISETHSATNDEIVALNLRLPVLRNVPARDILRLKEDNWPEFHEFRSAVRAAIKEQIDRAGSRSPEEIAEAVIEEYLTPELDRIERNLQVTRKNLGRKLGAGIAVGGASVTAGSIASIPLVIATGVAAIATSLPQVYKYFEDKGEIEKSPYYFLWRARVRDKPKSGHR